MIFKVELRTFEGIVEKLKRRVANNNYRYNRCCKKHINEVLDEFIYLTKEKIVKLKKEKNGK